MCGIVFRMNQDSGVHSYRSLRARGASQTDVRRAMRSGELMRLRRGWYAGPSADPTVSAAVTAGGVLGCVSALRARGVWVPPGSDLHIRSRRGGRNFCRPYGAASEPETAAIDEIPTALRYAVRCLDDEGLIVVCDSLLNLELLTLAEITHILRAAPPGKRRLIERCDLAESGTETMVRVRLRRRGIRVRPQVVIAGLGRVDLLVGRRLIIEIDGREYHIGAARFEADRERDRRAIQLGYLVIRVSYRQVMYDWAAVEATILELVRRRDHLRKMPAAAATNPVFSGGPRR